VNGICVAHGVRANSEARMNPAILVVDVASANREELKAFLRGKKFDVETAADGESAVKCCQRMQPDLILLYDRLRIFADWNFAGSLRRIPRTSCADCSA